MQVRSIDSKHLFSLDNLLDFLHKKADITDCLKQHRFLWRFHDTCFIMKMKWGRRNTCGDGTDIETKTVRKKQGRGRNVEGNNTAWTSRFTQMNNTKLPTGLLSTPVRDVRLQQTSAWLPGWHDDGRSTDILQGFCFCISQYVRWWKGW